MTAHMARMLQVLVQRRPQGWLEDRAHVTLSLSPLSEIVSFKTTEPRKAPFGRLCGGWVKFGFCVEKE